MDYKDKVVIVTGGAQGIGSNDDIQEADFEEVK